MIPVLINFVLDESGSMQPLRQSSIEGFNHFLKEQQAVPGEARMSLTVFDTSLDVRYVARPLGDLAPLGLVDYVPGGGTALLDAVGTSIKGAEEWVKNHRFTGKVIVAVLTDGEENSSHEWHIHQPMMVGDDRDLLGLIQWKQNEGWEFMFLGAGGSEWLEKTFAATVGADHVMAYAHDPLAHTNTYAGVSSSLTETRTTGASFVVPKAPNPSKRR